MFWSVDCLMHQSQLIMKSGLTLCDVILHAAGFEYKYFSSLAKIVNIWRESHKVSELATSESVDAHTCTGAYIRAIRERERERERDPPKRATNLFALNLIT